MFYDDDDDYEPTPPTANELDSKIQKIDEEYYEKTENLDSEISSLNDKFEQMLSIFIENQKNVLKSLEELQKEFYG